MVPTKLRRLLMDAVLEKSFRFSEKFEAADVELLPLLILYSDADGSQFMDEKSYEQFAFTAAGLETITTVERS